MLKINDQIENWNQFIIEGDMDALSQLYLHYYDLLFAYGEKHTIEKQAVEDAIQNTFINLIKFRKSIGKVKNLTGYLVTSFRRQLFLDIKKQTKANITEIFPEEHFDLFYSQDQDFSDNENQEQLYLKIRQCVNNLTSQQQEIIYLRFESGISYKEISEILHISIDSCYKSTYRSVKTIRSNVEKVLKNGEKHNSLVHYP